LRSLTSRHSLTRTRTFYLTDFLRHFERLVIEVSA
jgi:hypothetical protein